jgi:hypothetical protein
MEYDVRRTEVVVLVRQSITLSVELDLADMENGGELGLKNSRFAGLCLGVGL